MYKRQILNSVIASFISIISELEDGLEDLEEQLLSPEQAYMLGIETVSYTHLDVYKRQTLDGIGLFFQRDQTWWEEGKSFVDYITRCQTLLQYGHPVADIAVFTGEEMPRRSILPERLVRCV